MPLARLASAVLVPLVCTGALAAQRVRSDALDPRPSSDVAQGGTAAFSLDGDSPLGELARFEGRVDVFVQVLAYADASTASGTFTVAGLPAGATVRGAWLELTSFQKVPRLLASAVFDGVSLGGKRPDVSDFASSLWCSLYRYDVTALVHGNGTYPYQTSQRPMIDGDALVVVYEHPSLPLRTIALHDGAESLRSSSTVTTFEGMPCTEGELTLFTSGCNVSNHEEVRLNGGTVAGPADLFRSNQGQFASLVRIPVALRSGANEMELFTREDWLGLHLAVLSARGVTLGFEREDDFATPLANGQALSTPPEFGALLALSSTGPNAGPAIFDSAPLGPNDPSQDRDLLVGRGNVLILQNTQAPAQSVPGIFDRPNDDQDGGELVFDLAAPSSPRCIVLVDVDAGATQGASVVLTDVAGRTRTFTVPPSWTGDVLADGPPGWRELALDTLDPQPGFLSVATAAEGAGFDPAGVVRITVRLGSSGAVDDLVLAD